ALLETLLGEEAGTLAELALRFCLAHPAVSTVIPGMRTAKHVQDNTWVSDRRRLSDRLLTELTHHAWERNFYQ
ncbi:MAG: aldo/keto reductase, partial [Nitrospirales bacterium]